MGKRTMSSSLAPPKLPDEASTPITVSGILATSMDSPTGSNPRPSLAAVVDPSTATGDWSFTCAAVKNVPLESVRLRTVGQDDVVPTICVVQFFVPAVTFAKVMAVGATAAMSGQSTCEPKSLALAYVNVVSEPKPPCTPPDDVELPGVTMRRLVPSSAIEELTDDVAPSPRPTVRITAAMPMSIPSTVRAERSRCPTIASKPDLSVSTRLTSWTHAEKSLGRTGSSRL